MPKMTEFIFQEKILDLLLGPCPIHSARTYSISLKKVSGTKSSRYFWNLHLFYYISLALGCNTIAMKLVYVFLSVSSTGGKLTTVCWKIRGPAFVYLQKQRPVVSKITLLWQWGSCSHCEPLAFHKWNKSFAGKLSVALTFCCVYPGVFVCAVMVTWPSPTCVCDIGLCWRVFTLRLLVPSIIDGPGPEDMSESLHTARVWQGHTEWQGNSPLLSPSTFATHTSHNPALVGRASHTRKYS